MIGSLSGNKVWEDTMSMRASFLGAALTVTERIVQACRAVTYHAVNLVRDLCAACTVPVCLLAPVMWETGKISHTNLGKIALFLAIIVPAVTCVGCHFLKRHLAKRWLGVGSSGPTS